MFFLKFLQDRFFSILPLKSRFSLETDSKNSFSRSRCVGSDPGILANPAGELKKTKLVNKNKKLKIL